MLFYKLHSVPNRDKFSCWYCYCYYFGYYLYSDCMFTKFCLKFCHKVMFSAGDCDFEIDKCSWSNMKTDDFDWVVGSGTTTSSSTGPSSDHTKGNSQGNYLKKHILICWTAKGEYKSSRFRLNNCNLWQYRVSFHFKLTSCDITPVPSDLKFNLVCHVYDCF